MGITACMNCQRLAEHSVTTVLERWINPILRFPLYSHAPVIMSDEGLQAADWALERPTLADLEERQDLFTRWRRSGEPAKWQIGQRAYLVIGHVSALRRGECSAKGGLP
jgi:hypothetical protein